MRLANLLFTLILLFFSNISIADPIHVIYINGIGNELSDAKDSRDKIDVILKESRIHQADKLDFVVRYVWNPVGYNGVNELFNSELHDDYKELFLLKTSEEWFTAPFTEIIPDGHPTSVESIVNAAGVVNNYYEDMTPGFNSLESNGIINDTDMNSVRIATSELIDKIEDNINNKQPTVIVAHSQGNLLANLAYANLISRLGVDINKYIKFVNVANTSKFSINNLNLTHANDRALIELRNFPQVFNETATRQNSTRNTPFCDGVCNFEIMESTFSGANLSILNVLKHGLDTYISESDLPNTVIANSTTTGSPNFTGIDFTVGKTTFRDRFEDLVYAAANSFEDEDDDLHPSAPVGIEKIVSGVPVNNFLNNATISENGQYIVYSNSTTENSKLFLYDNSTKNTKELSINNELLKELSVNKTYGLYIRGLKIINNENLYFTYGLSIFKINLSTEELHKVSGDRSIADDEYSINNNENTHYYLSHNGEPGRVFYIYKYNINSDTESIALDTDAEYYNNRSISDDGSIMVYRISDQHAGIKNPGIYINNLITKKEEQISTANYLSNSSMSNDGNYVTFAPILNGEIGESNISLYNVNSKELKTIGTGQYPNISNDGRYIAYTNNNSIFRYDRVENKTISINVAPAYTQISLSGNGKYVMYKNMVSDNGVRAFDMFLWTIE